MSFSGLRWSLSGHCRQLLTTLEEEGEQEEKRSEQEQLPVRREGGVIKKEKKTRKRGEGRKDGGGGPNYHSRQEIYMAELESPAVVVFSIKVRDSLIFLYLL